MANSSCRSTAWRVSDVMLHHGYRCGRIAALCLSVSLGAVFGAASAGRAEPPNPVLNTLFPPGGRAGTSVDVAIDGGSLDGTATLRFSNPSIVATKGEGSRFTVTIPAQTPPGTYDVRAIGTFGISSPRSFVVGSRPEELETEPNDQIGSAVRVPLDVVINGRIEKPGDVDCYRFTATAGQRIVLECQAERIDSQLRGVIEVNDALGNRLAANRGYAGIDPLVDFIVPADGEYTVKVFDLTYAGGGAHFYRLEIDTGPRVEFTVPAVIERGKTTRVALFGRNLLARPATVRPAIVRQAGGEASSSVAARAARSGWPATWRGSLTGSTWTSLRRTLSIATGCVCALRSGRWMDLHFATLPAMPR